MTECEIQTDSDMQYDIHLEFSEFLSETIKKFSCESMIFSVYKIFQEMRLTTMIMFEIKNAVDISSILIISNDNRFSELHMLIR